MAVVTRCCLAVLAVLPLACGAQEGTNSEYESYRWDEPGVCSDSQAVSVDTSFGKVWGQTLSNQLGDTCERFVAIPYAKPPVGEKRFAPTEPWTDPYPPGGWVPKTRGYAPCCPQTSGQGVMGDDNCLILNLWRPLHSTRESKLPIMVDIHGGFYYWGTGNPIIFQDKDHQVWLPARNNMILVTFDFRLGPLGFSAFENEDGSINANLGIQDQQMLLRWLQHESRNFGGDPSKVTILGGSSGGGAVWVHMISPASKGLFRAAVIESAPPYAKSKQYSLAHTKEYARKVGCTTGPGMVACLRGRSGGTLIGNADENAGMLGDGWWPTVDGNIVPDFPDKMVYEGRTHAIPLLVGYNTNDSNSLSFGAYSTSLNEFQFAGFIDKTIRLRDPAQGLTADELALVHKMYPYPSDSPDSRIEAGTFHTDFNVLCPGRNGGARHAQHAPFYFYRFDYRSRCTKSLHKIPGIPHAMDDKFLWNHLEDDDGCKGEGSEFDLQGRTQQMVFSFIKNLRPETGDSEDPGFPMLTDMQGPELVMTVPHDRVETGYRQSYCTFWDKLSKAKHERQAKFEDLAARGPPAYGAASSKAELGRGDNLFLQQAYATKPIDANSIHENFKAEFSQRSGDGMVFRRIKQAKAVFG